MRPLATGVSVFLLGCVLAARAAVLVTEHQPRAVIVVPAATARPAADARAIAGFANEAAQELSRYLGQATGATLPIVHENELAGRTGDEARIFVGACAASAAVPRAADIPPEGFAIRIAGRDVFIRGNDLTADGIPVRGTVHGALAFLETYLGVRWLMPGELGDVVPARASLTLDDGELRDAPLLWVRSFRNSANTHLERAENALKKWHVSIPEWEAKFTNVAPDWFRHQRLGRRVKVNYGHAYAGWWDRYHEKYPEIFALQPNGTRDVGNVREKFCVSNPTYWELVAQEKIRELKADPTLLAASISPNDGTSRSVHCVCEACRAWDPKTVRLAVDSDPDAAGKKAEQVLTDRYFHFYNEVARRVAREMPDRLLGCYAYSIYRQPPLELDHLEPNLLVGYVGFESYLSDRKLAADRAEWAQWGRLARQLFLRPNLFWADRGFPQNYVRKLAGDLRAMVASGMRAADFDGVVGNWGTGGLGYYAVARLLWNVQTDVDAIIDDYCRAAYGPGAPAMKRYYAKLEAFTDRIAREEKYDVTKGQRDRLDNLVAYYTEDVLADWKRCTDEALAAIGSTDDRAAQRVRLISDGFDYAHHAREIVLSAAAVRAGRMKRADYEPILAAADRRFGELAMGWAVSAPHVYPYLLRSLQLK